MNKNWLPTRAFERVPWPPPARSTTLALFLFLFGADLRPESTTDIARAQLYRLVGTYPGRPSHRARDLERALAGVNSHLVGLGPGLAKLGCPTRFKMVESGEDRVRFVAHEAEFRDGDEDGEDARPVVASTPQIEDEEDNEQVKDRLFQIYGRAGRPDKGGAQEDEDVDVRDDDDEAYYRERARNEAAEERYFRSLDKKDRSENGASETRFRRS